MGSAGTFYRPAGPTQKSRQPWFMPCCGSIQRQSFSGVTVRPLVPLSAAIVLALGAAAPARAQTTGLPDIGSSAAELLTPQQELEYGAYTLYQLRRYGYVLEDPLIEGWLASLGHRLAAASDRPEQPFTFFLMRDRQINA